jgi:hypothetical protein
MASRPAGAATNGHAKRSLTSWIESFVEYTVDLESPENFRRWTAIGILAAVMEQKCYCEVGGTGKTMFPNLYTWLIAPPGIGKSSAVKVARDFLTEIPEMFVAPVSLTAASLVDYVAESKRTIIRLPGPAVEYNSVVLVPDELAAFMAEYERETVALLTSMYDCDATYSQHRRTSGIKITINRPQINMIVGSTPSNLIEYVPKNAWDQGFTSRILLIHGKQRLGNDDPFEVTTKRSNEALLDELKLINTLGGRFTLEEPFRLRLKSWRGDGLPPVPDHRRLRHYITRRWAHVLKLAMISSVDRGDSLTLTVEDFDRATGWLFEAEAEMPAIFEEGIVHVDTAGQDELAYYIKSFNGKLIGHHQIQRKAMTLMSIHAVTKTIAAFVEAGMLVKVSQDPRTMFWTYKGGA